MPKILVAHPPGKPYGLAILVSKDGKPTRKEKWFSSMPERNRWFLLHRAEMVGVTLYNGVE
jgi:hypothetical protein